MRLEIPTAGKPPPATELIQDLNDFACHANAFRIAADLNQSRKPAPQPAGLIQEQGRGNARRPVSRVLSPPVAGRAMTIPLGCLLPGTSRDRPGRRRGNTPVRRTGRAAPIWSCSGWGLPCRPCYQGRGALLPHPFTLTVGPKPAGGLLSVALSLGSPPPGVTRHPCSRGARTFLDTALAGAAAAIRPSGPCYLSDRGRFGKRETPASLPPRGLSS